MSEPYADFQSLKFDRPAERVLRIRLHNPGKLNAVDARMHKELADVWRVVDTDPEVSAVILTGTGEAFSAGGDFEVLESLTRDQNTRLTVWKEARDIVYNVINCSKPVISAIRGPAVGGGPGRGSGGRYQCRIENGALHRRPHPPRCGGRGSRRHRLAPAGGNGEGQVLPAHL